MNAGAVALQPIPKRWYCPNCNHRDVTIEARPHTRFHPCPGLGGVVAPMIEQGQDVKVFAVVREDYIGGELVQTDERGRPIMAVVTERPDGSNDCAVLAPTATADWSAR